mmetsp:Transcript_8871/g.23441  ORF Transcript_8871/g.23441 Transcript_8871/m.23441 type:complete len:258 (+) Transcript_8871:3-776(+)
MSDARRALSGRERDGRPSSPRGRVRPGPGIRGGSGGARGGEGREIDRELLLFRGRRPSRAELRGVACERGLALQPQDLEHVFIVGKFGVGRREELVACEDGVRTGKEHEGLCLLGELHTAGRQADAGLRHDHLRRRDGPHHVVPMHGLALPDDPVSQRRPLNRDQRVDGHGLRVLGQVREGREQADAVLFCLSNAKDAAAAHANARLAHVRERLQPVCECARVRDLAVVLRARVQVVIVCGETGVLQPLGLIDIDHA